MATKTCFKCNQLKDLSEFYKHNQMADGHLNKCKECTRRGAAERYSDPESKKRIVDYERRRFQDPRRKKLVAEYRKRRDAENPTKYIARTKVNNAVRDGRLVKLPCEVCGDIKSEAHHEDYRSPLKVKWLCFKHHREAHGQSVS